MESGVLPFFASILLFFRSEVKVDVPPAPGSRAVYGGKPDATELLVERAHDLLDGWFGRGDIARFIRDLKTLRKELIRHRRSIDHRARQPRCQHRRMGCVTGARTIAAALLRAMARILTTTGRRARRQAAAQDLQQDELLRSQLDDVITRIDSDVIRLQGQRTPDQASLSCR